MAFAPANRLKNISEQLLSIQASTAAFNARPLRLEGLGAKQQNRARHAVRNSRGRHAPSSASAIGANKRTALNERAASVDRPLPYVTPGRGPSSQLPPIPTQKAAAAAGPSNNAGAQSPGSDAFESLSSAQMFEMAERKRHMERGGGGPGALLPRQGMGLPSVDEQDANYLPPPPPPEPSQRHGLLPSVQAEGPSSKPKGYARRGLTDKVAFNNKVELAEEFNHAVRVLKDRLEQKGANAITSHFRTLDLDGSGALDSDEFMRAMNMLNLGIGKPILEEIMRSVDVDGSGNIDYAEFCDSLKFKRITFKQLPPRKAGGARWRQGPDPELPFGDPTTKLPFGIMSDAVRNLETFDSRMNGKWSMLEKSFQKFDVNGNGEVDIHEFKKALKDLKALNLSEYEIQDLFRDADKDGSGQISYDEFAKAFGGGGANKKRFIPEFLKPKGNRRSQNGHPWEWDIEGLKDFREKNSRAKHSVRGHMPVPASEFFRHLEGEEAALAAKLHHNAAMKKSRAHGGYKSMIGPGTPMSSAA